jgi:hypothetical protein
MITKPRGILKMLRAVTVVPVAAFAVFLFLPGPTSSASGPLSLPGVWRVPRARWCGSSTARRAAQLYAMPRSVQRGDYVGAWIGRSGHASSSGRQSSADPSCARGTRQLPHVSRSVGADGGDPYVAPAGRRWLVSASVMTTGDDYRLQIGDLRSPLSNHQRYNVALLKPKP